MGFVTLALTIQMLCKPGLYSNFASFTLSRQQPSKLIMNERMKKYPLVVHKYISPSLHTIFVICRIIFKNPCEFGNMHHVGKILNHEFLTLDFDKSTLFKEWPLDPNPNLFIKNI